MWLQKIKALSIWIGACEVIPLVCSPEIITTWHSAQDLTCPPKIGTYHMIFGLKYTAISIASDFTHLSVRTVSLYFLTQIYLFFCRAMRSQQKAVQGSQNWSLWNTEWMLMAKPSYLISTLPHLKLNKNQSDRLHSSYVGRFFETNLTGICQMNSQTFIFAQPFRSKSVSILCVLSGAIFHGPCILGSQSGLSWMLVMHLQQWFLE